MSLAALIANTQKVAEAAREEIARQNAAEVVEFEEYGEELRKAFDDEELTAAEEALRLGMQLDEEEDNRLDEQDAKDLAFARQLLEDEKSEEASHLSHAQACAHGVAHHRAGPSHAPALDPIAPAALRSRIAVRCRRN